MAARASRWARLLTESRNPRSRKLDTLSTDRVVALLLDEDRRAIVAAARERSAIARAARLAADTLAHGGDIVLSRRGHQRTARHPRGRRMPAHLRLGPAPHPRRDGRRQRSVFLAREGAEDREGAGRDEGARLTAADLLVGISASSVTPFVRGALGAARAQGASTVLVTCAPGRGLSRLADVVIAVRSGPEVLTGSTRLKAGSATKAVLNAITTAAMVRLGKAYENLMVDLKPTSAKLVDRTAPHRRRGDEEERRRGRAASRGGRRRGQDRDRHGPAGRVAGRARERLARAKGHVARLWARLVSLRRRRCRAGCGSVRCSRGRSRRRTRLRS